MKTFLSFSSKDAGFVAKLKARLKAQPLNLWDYSSEAEEIPGGVAVASYLSERVAASDVFIPLVTPHSIASTYTQIEVRTALERAALDGTPRILPLVQQSMTGRDANWGAVYEPLRSLRWFEVDFEKRDQWEESVRRICESLGLAGQYRGLMPERPLLPFMERFDEELRTAKERDPERFHGIYARLERIKNELVVALDGGDHERARKLTEFFLSICEYEFPSHRFYYASITKLICQIGLGRFSDALEEARLLLNHPKRDETLFGLLGYIYQAQGSYEEAARYYRDAFERDPADVFAAAGLVINTTLANRSDGLDQALRVLETNAAASLHDRAEAEIVRAYALATRGDTASALNLFNSAIRAGSKNPSAYIGWARAFADLRRFDDAEEALARGVAICPFPEEVYKWKACFHSSLRDQRKALLCLERAIEDPRVTPGPELLGHRLQLLSLCGRHADAQHHAAELLASLGRPSSPDDFYHAGLANWILGRRHRAEYDFERSGRDPEEYYG